MFSTNSISVAIPEATPKTINPEAEVNKSFELVDYTFR